MFASISIELLASEQLHMAYFHFFVSVLILNVDILKSKHDLKVTSKFVFQSVSVLGW